jgi:GNAT superfamily N-acetyltransferase
VRARLVEGLDRADAIARLASSWGDPMVVRGERWLLGDCEILVAGAGEGVAAVCGRDRPVAEIVVIEAFDRRQGIGTVLIDAIIAHCRDFEALRLCTTNDNLDALRFYQRRGFRLSAVRPDAVTQARRLKPSIPLVGDYGIEMCDEIDLVLPLRAVDSPEAFL